MDAAADLFRSDLLGRPLAEALLSCDAAGLAARVIPYGPPRETPTLDDATGWRVIQVRSIPEGNELVVITTEPWETLAR